MAKDDLHHADCVRDLCTLNHYPTSDAEMCRRRGWKVGDIIEGDEGYGPERILITAIGERRLLARSVDSKHEGAWTLTCRCWKRVVES